MNLFMKYLGISANNSGFSTVAYEEGRSGYVFPIIFSCFDKSIFVALFIGRTWPLVTRGRKSAAQDNRLTTRGTM